MKFHFPPVARSVPSSEAVITGGVILPKSGILRRGFLTSPVMVALSSSLVVAVKREDSNLNGLIQPQRQPVGFGSSREIVVWDQEEDDSFLDPLDWAYEDEDPPMALLAAIEEDLHREAEVARPKSKGKKELFKFH